MAVNPEDYIKKRRLTVTLTSGDEFVLRKFKRATNSKLMGMLGVTVTQNTEVEMLRAEVQEAISTKDLNLMLPELLEIIIPDGIAKPNIVVSKPDPNDDTIMEIDDIEPKDQLELFNLIMDYNGFSEEAVKTRENFPLQS